MMILPPKLIIAIAFGAALVVAAQLSDTIRIVPCLNKLIPYCDVIWSGTLCRRLPG